MLWFSQHQARGEGKAERIFTLEIEGSCKANISFPSQTTGWSVDMVVYSKLPEQEKQDWLGNSGSAEESDWDVVRVLEFLSGLRDALKVTALSCLSNTQATRDFFLRL